MRTAYQGPAGRHWTYVCHGEKDRGGGGCWTVSGRAIDAPVEDLLLKMIIPSELDLTLAVSREAEAQAESLHEQWKLRIEQADYEARLAERRYMAVDPDNRVVARTLENEWEARLQSLEETRQRYESAKRERRVQLTEEDMARADELGSELLEKISQEGMRAYFEKSSADTKLDLAPLLEAVNETMQGLRGNEFGPR